MTLSVNGALVGGSPVFEGFGRWSGCIMRVFQSSPKELDEAIPIHRIAARQKRQSRLCSICSAISGPNSTSYDSFGRGSSDDEIFATSWRQQVTPN